MRSLQLTSVTVAAMLSVAATDHFAGQPTFTVGIVDFYGLRQLSETQVRLALGIVEGDSITESALELVATIPGAPKDKFETAAGNAKAGCPISRLLNTKITLNARLEA